MRNRLGRYRFERELDTQSICDGVKEMNSFFVIAATRNSNLFLVSFYESMELANKAMCKTIDADALQIVPAQIQFAKNGNVRLWRSI